MKLVTIDANNLGVPSTDSKAQVTIPASQFSRAVRDCLALTSQTALKYQSRARTSRVEARGQMGYLLRQMLMLLAGNSSKMERQKMKTDTKEEQKEMVTMRRL